LNLSWRSTPSGATIEDHAPQDLEAHYDADVSNMLRVQVIELRVNLANAVTPRERPKARATRSNGFAIWAVFAFKSRWRFCVCCPLMDYFKL
jgi:hypothetical protein